MKESFVLYTGQYIAIKSLSLEAKGELLDALYRYVIDGTVPSFTTPEIKMAFNFIRIQIDRDQQKYITICEKRAMAGKRGGRPKTKKTNALKKSKAKQEKLGNPDNDTDNDNDNDTDNIYIKKTKKENLEKKFIEIVKDFNSQVSNTGSSVKPVRVLNDLRRESLAKILSMYSHEQIRIAIHNALMSSYVNGRTAERKRPVDFDWLIEEKNFARAFEGSL
jgi:hypothetical protein